MALSYLSNEGSFGCTAALFGVSKSTAITNVNEVLDMLPQLSPYVISFPTTAESAIDGSLFEIERPYEYEGWICRKGWAAINMQATVDRDGRFMEYSLRAGFCSDKNLWTMSSLGSSVASVIPHTINLLGDAGYTLSAKFCRSLSASQHSSIDRV
ncbi:putative nuclease harbi1 [Aphanomyces cochlioides]|nr:putative nuclease harbi1 [Aphanomyces cochlioides]